MIIKAPTRRLPLMILVAAGAAVLSVVPATAEPSKTAAAAKPSQASPKAGKLPADAQMGWRNRDDGKLAGADAGVRAYAPTGVLGLDVSSYQGNVNWTRWVARGKSFAYVKATQGTSYRNPYFSSQYTDSYYAGMVRGAYHYANPSRTERHPAGPVLREARRRLVEGQPDPARRARHRVRPARPRLLRVEQGEDDQVDHRLHGRVQAAHRLATR